MHVKLKCYFFFFSIILTGQIDFGVNTSSDGQYRLSINNTTFLTSQRFFVISNGTTYERTNLTLNSTERGSTTDHLLGRYTFTKFTFVVPDLGNTVEAWIKDFTPKPFITFEMVRLRIFHVQERIQAVEH